jgi:RimJ/RimL family protein N-acetyltransferase
MFLFLREHRTFLKTLLPHAEQVSVRRVKKSDTRDLMRLFVEDESTSRLAGESFINNAGYVNDVVTWGHGALSKTNIATFSVVVKKRVVGCIQLYKTRYFDLGKADDRLRTLGGTVVKAHSRMISWFVHTSWRRQGIMQTAVPLVLEQARANGIGNVIAVMQSDDVASARLAAKLALVNRGTYVYDELDKGAADVWELTHDKQSLAHCGREAGAEALIALACSAGVKRPRDELSAGVSPAPAPAPAPAHEPEPVPQMAASASVSSVAFELQMVAMMAAVATAEQAAHEAAAAAAAAKQAVCKISLFLATT